MLAGGPQSLAEHLGREEPRGWEVDIKRDPSVSRTWEGGERELQYREDRSVEALLAPSPAGGQLRLGWGFLEGVPLTKIGKSSRR